MTRDAEQATKDERYAPAFRQFFVLVAGSEFFVPLDGLIEGIAPALQDIGTAFRHNLRGAITTLEIPAFLAGAGGQATVFQRLHLAETLRAKASHIRDGVEGEASAERYRSRALDAAAKRMAEESEAVADAASELLLRALDTPEGVEAAQELRRQGVVLVWGTIEVLSRAVFAQYLNARPKEIKCLLDSPAARKITNLRGLDFELLQEYGFDVSRDLGRILASQQDLSRLQAIREILTAIFPRAHVLRDALNSRDLWTLNQRRHLIVHHRGIVDQRYLAATGDTLAVGERLKVSPSQLEAYLSLARDLGISLLGAAESGLSGA